MRLQVFLSRSGVASRRRALCFIQSGRVCVNRQKVTEPSYPVEPGVDSVTLDDRPITQKEKITLILHKPRGVITTKEDRFAEKKVTDFLPPRLKHLYPVGRLDKDTTGLLVLTNDGELALSLAHPSFEVTKVYRARLAAPLAARECCVFERGIVLDGKKTSPCRLRRIGPLEVEITIHEGRKRQIRRMFEALGHRVTALSRIKQGPLALGDLRPGEWRYLTPQEIRALSVLGKTKPRDASPPFRRKR